jgi:DNA topoisomerase I
VALLSDHPLAVPDADDPEALAASAGLRYVTDAEPGIRRRRRGRGFSYHHPDGSRVDAAERSRIEAMAVPPAWTDVWIGPEADGHLLATGRDAAGRKQYLYHPAWRAAADAAKFRRLGQFGLVLPRLRAAVRADLRRADPDQDMVAAAVIRLIDRTHVRVGNQCYTELNGTYGASTLLEDHVTVADGRIDLHFTAKGGIEQELSVFDPLLADAIDRCLDLGGPQLFTFVDDDEPAAIDGERLNAYLRRVTGEPVTVKDFRTWGATAAVAGHLATSAEADPDTAERTAIEHAAELLGNTPAVARASYVAPAVLSAHRDGTLADRWRRTRRGRDLSRSEHLTVKLLNPDPTARR